jgi:hypothetical protein
LSIGQAHRGPVAEGLVDLQGLAVSVLGVGEVTAILRHITERVVGGGQVAPGIGLLGDGLQGQADLRLDGLARGQLACQPHPIGLGPHHEQPQAPRLGLESRRSAIGPLEVGAAALDPAVGLDAQAPGVPERIQRLQEA